MRTFRANVEATASPDLPILTIWKPMDSTFEKSLGNIRWLNYLMGHSDLILC